MPLARQRRLDILAELEIEGAVRVATLAERFGVAEETVRRDLDYLHAQGRLARTHGGAISIRNQRFDLPVAVRRNSQAQEKQAIAQTALGFIEPHNVIALDASTTVLELVQLLPDMPLTLITYGLDVARLMIDRPQINVFCTGGEVDAKSVCLLGPHAEASLRQFSIDKAFFSTRGIDLERGYSEASTAHASIKRLLIQLADRSYLMADHTKFGVRSTVYSSGLSDVDVLITDEQTDLNFHEALRDAGVEVLVGKNGIAERT